MDFGMGPLDFFIWDDLIDPGKEYQCPSCGRLMDDSCIVPSDEHDDPVCECPDCGTLSEIDE